MNIIFPMAGEGKRFLNAGYTIPKYLIEVFGKTLLQYSVDSIPFDKSSNLIFIALNDHIIKYNLKDVIASILKIKFQLIGLENVTRGQAETVLSAENYIDASKDLLIYNIDTSFKSKKLSNKLRKEDLKYDGIIGAFIGNGSNWSYAEVDENGFVLKTAEKNPISDLALTGMYHFSDPSNFFRVAKSHINLNKLSKSEFYIAPMYNDLILEGKKFVVDLCDKLIPLGTPEDLELFKKKGNK